MTRHYFSQLSDVKPVAGQIVEQRITLYHVSLDGKRHEVPATHRDMLQIMRLMMKANASKVEARNG